MQIVLKINTAYGKVGDTVTVGSSLGERLVRTGQAELAASNKAVESAEPKRGPGRPKKVRVDNKAVGA